MENGNNIQSSIEENKNIFLKSQQYQKCWPATRCDLLRKSSVAYTRGNESKAIYYESKALCCGFMANKCVLNGKNKKVTENTICEVLQTPSKHSNPLLNFINEKMAGLSIDINDINNNVESNQREDFDIKELNKKYLELPKEWNVVQIVKSCENYMGCATSRDMYTQPTSVNVTLFRYVLSEKLDNQPICIHLGFFSEKAKSLLTNAYDIYQKSYKDYPKQMNTATYQTYMQKLILDLSTLIQDLQTWIGPWISLFSGKIKGENGEQFEKQIFNEIEEFFNEKGGYTTKQNVLLCIIARRLDLLNSDKVKQAANDISTNKTQYLEIMRFLAHLKTKLCFKGFSYYPCILILDEYLDTIPWEMLNPAQELTRFSSIYLLFDSYAEYKGDISDGYLQVNIKTGNVLINPSNDPKLNLMERRLSDFYSHWLPHWTRFENKIPNHEEMAKLVTGADVYIYSGHGSGLQFSNMSNLKKLTTKSVILLFGCESVAMKLGGLVSEATSSHLTLQTTKCPAILGAMNIISDIWSDIITIMILTQWIPTKNTKIWKPVHIGEDKKTQERIVQILDNLKSVKVQPSLLASVAAMRNESNLSTRMRSAMIYRGLPVYNIAAANLLK